MLIDLSDRAKLRVSGADRVRFLNGQLTNDLRDAKPGQATYACVLTAKGKLCGDLFVTPIEDAFLLDFHPALREALPARLEKYAIADDVEFADQTDEFSLFHAPAPKLPDTILPEGIVSHADRFGVEGHDLLVPVTLKGVVPQLLKEDVLPAAEVETFRIERGIPEWGHELNEDVIPNEAGLDQRAVSYTKGCYVGQEVISRLKSLGHVNRKLCGIQLIDGSVLVTGQKLLNASGKQTGFVTSAARSEQLGAWIGLAYVKRNFDQAGSRYHLQNPDNSDLIGTAELRSLPIIP
ncbi:MAG: folate-binding protein YgfZ [Verrucomicrobia bacterium]|nr:folate-binding protein YgfZ [Verrucomicrobiota bacterium]MBV8278167.1 folate-binding protein YgfZ [Verrucomicrobiota bacterium]